MGRGAARPLGGSGNPRRWGASADGDVLEGKGTGKGQLAYLQVGKGARGWWEHFEEKWKRLGRGSNMHNSILPRNDFLRDRDEWGVAAGAARTGGGKGRSVR